jgi:lipopolysaccharide/colanic/teichoic acid biosynthesis glycosyltransferase
MVRRLRTVTKLRYDLYYVRHRSPLLDVVILLKTFKVVLQLKGV